LEEDYRALMVKAKRKKKFEDHKALMAKGEMKKNWKEILEH